MWMIVVFLFSKEQSNETINTSEIFTERILNVVTKIIDIQEFEKGELVQILNPYVRKFAHYSLYTTGGILIIIHISQYKKLTGKKRIIISLIIGISYAISDEIHQYMVPGREGKMQDVYLDSLGIATGIVIILIIINIYEKIKYISNLVWRGNND